MSEPAPTAPPDIAMPDYVDSWFGQREEMIIDHGFEEKQLALRWWKDALVEAGLGGLEVTVDPLETGATKLTRGALFELGQRATDDDSTLTFLLHVLAWGSGTGTRNNRRRLAAFSSAELRGENLARLRDAMRTVREDDPDATRRAYGSLIRRGGGVIPGLGPAFFTKFLYFAGRGEGAVPSLILDARVASSLCRAGWTTLPHNPRSGSFSYNWYTDTYVSYCSLLKRWAKLAETDVLPDEIERALFEDRGVTSA